MSNHRLGRPRTSGKHPWSKSRFAPVGFGLIHLNDAPRRIDDREFALEEILRGARMDLNRDLASLVRQIDAMVETVSVSPVLDDTEIRRTLRFITQVIQVVEQAFQDVLTLLVEVKYLTVDELRSSKLTELRKQVDLLTARSHYRDAAEICSRLKYLRITFDESIRPSLEQLPELSGWQGVLGLIEDREGRIIMLIEQTAHDLEKLLSSAQAETLPEISERASKTADLLRLLLSDLHELNGRILGYSGRAGLLELTRDRHRLEREIQIMVDKRDQSVTHGHRVEIGDNNTIGSLITATTVQESFNHVQHSEAGAEVKAALSRLCAQVDELLNAMPGEQRKEVEQDLSSFVTEATKERPRKKWYELSASGLIEAAKACAGAASPVISSVNVVLALLAGPM